jgi:hypothetical protein
MSRLTVWPSLRKKTPPQHRTRAGSPILTPISGRGQDSAVRAVDLPDSVASFGNLAATCPSFLGASRALWDPTLHKLGVLRWTWPTEAVKQPLRPPAAFIGVGLTTAIRGCSQRSDPHRGETTEPVAPPRLPKPRAGSRPRSALASSNPCADTCLRSLLPHSAGATGGPTVSVPRPRVPHIAHSVARRADYSTSTPAPAS